MLNERVYNDGLPIKYVLEREQKSDFLVIIFSSFNSPNAKTQYSYNYMRTLSNMKCNKLFILDNYGPRGCYYLGEAMSFNVESSVISLIRHISTQLNIPSENIITAGSSKGGSAALYYGLKYHFGHIIAGAPQIKIADYILTQTEDIPNYMLGTEKKAQCAQQLNSLIFEQLDKDVYSEIIIFSSENDFQYKHHIIPFIQEMDNRNIAYTLTINNNAINHQDVAIYYPSFLCKNVLKIISGIVLDDYCFSIQNNGNLNITVAAENMKLPTKLSIIQDGKIYNELTFVSKYHYQIEEPGLYQFKLDFFYKEEVIYSVYSIKSLIGVDLFDYQGYNCNIEGGIIKFELKISSNTDLKYAYYLLKDNVTIDKYRYDSNNTYQFPITESGKYQVRFFIKAGHKIISDISSIYDCGISSITDNKPYQENVAFSQISTKEVHKKRSIDKRSLIIWIVLLTGILCFVLAGALSIPDLKGYLQTSRIEKIESINITFEQDGNTYIFTNDATGFNSNITYAWYVIKSLDTNNVIYRQMYREDNTFTYTFKPGADYRIEAFTLKDDGTKQSKIVALIKYDQEAGTFTCQLMK